MGADINSKVLDYVEKTSEALGVALKISEDVDRVKAASEERIPHVVQQLKSAGLIEEHEVKSAAQQLSDPVQALNVLSDVLTYYTKQAAAATKEAALQLGRGDGVVSPAPAMDKHANVTGHRRGYNDEMPESDRVLLKFL